ncbi:MAG: MotA/TolQ/ExbB proton channel family protein [Pseudobdellovibrionaceae bacterium]|uniref:MotA/TolQ/ExbB proton channel family protein n=1 Tax=Oligoflexus sp. TaxID=1971216 RepID=UPI0027C089B9|nr:MotA/TolQ/ExbB proton channel family protein [Oligoflexus sp.]MDQ3234098.1 MotA/TolQ/ExbB proton channel family protein [Pseudobdellovibrionaceae bacterium]HYX34415.1 MotA/TolQ/ExbB proton channel family protein [Oligoflexus sp.]
MDGLSFKKYMQTTQKRFDPLALILSLAGIGAVLYSMAQHNKNSSFFDFHSFMIVLGGTLASLTFQFDLRSMLSSVVLVSKSFLGTPEKPIMGIVKELDDAILNQAQLAELREGLAIDGELLNDIVFMHHQGLLFEEIDEFVTSRVADQYLGRKIAVEVLRKGVLIAPAFGLFGTVMGLIGVLKTLSDPSNIGNSMSLALMTTAYGAGLSSLVFTPLAGRLEHHNMIYLDVHQQILSKIGILLKREERTLEASGIG